MSKGSEFQQIAEMAQQAARSHGVIPGKGQDFHWAWDMSTLDSEKCHCEIGKDH